MEDAVPLALQQPNRLQHKAISHKRSSLLKTARPFRICPHQCGEGVVVFGRNIVPALPHQPFAWIVLLYFSAFFRGLDAET